MLLVQLITGYSDGFCPPVVAIDPQSLSLIRPLVWPAALAKCFFFAGIHAAARGTYHVVLITLRLLQSSFCRSGASNGAYLVPISQAVRALVPKMLEQTDRHGRSNFVFVTHHYRPNDKSLWQSIGAFITGGRHRIRALPWD